AQIGGAAQPVEHAQIGGVEAAQQDGRENTSPHRQFRKPDPHDRFPSLRATSPRRLVIHQIPPSSTEPVETTSGNSSSTRQVSIGSGSCGTLVRSPICSKGTAER